MPDSFRQCLLANWLTHKAWKSSVWVQVRSELEKKLFNFGKAGLNLSMVVIENFTSILPYMYFTKYCCFIRYFWCLLLSFLILSSCSFAASCLCLILEWPCFLVIRTLIYVILFQCGNSNYGMLYYFLKVVFMCI